MYGWMHPTKYYKNLLNNKPYNKMKYITIGCYNSIRVAASCQSIHCLGVEILCMGAGVSTANTQDPRKRTAADTKELPCVWLKRIIRGFYCQSGEFNFFLICYYNDVTWALWRFKLPTAWQVLSTAWSEEQKGNQQHSELLIFCERSPTVTSELPSQRASNADSASMSWCQHMLGRGMLPWASLGGGNRYDDVINWKHFSCYWPFDKTPWRGALMFLLCAPEQTVE